MKTCFRKNCGREWDPGTGAPPCLSQFCPLKKYWAIKQESASSSEVFLSSANGDKKRSNDGSENQNPLKKPTTSSTAPAPKPPAFLAPVKQIPFHSPMETSITQVSRPRRSEAYYDDGSDIAHLKHSLVTADVLIPGIRLMVMGYNCIKEAIGAAGVLPVCGPPQRVAFKDSTKQIEFDKPCYQFRLVSPHQYLQCAGALSIKTKLDFQRPKRLPCQLIIGQEKALVTIIEHKSTEFLYFHLAEGPSALPYWGVVKLLRTCGFENDAVCAKHLLALLKGKNVAVTPAVATKLDSVNALIFALEGSRNNLTYLTAIMALEMVRDYQFDFHTAFECTGLFGKPAFSHVYKWFDFEGKKTGMFEPIFHDPRSPAAYDESRDPAFRGGFFPMATFDSGGGHFTKRREALQAAEGQWPKRIITWSKDLKYHGVAVKELDLILSWLKRKRPELRFKTAFEALRSVESLFKETLQKYFPKKSAAPAINIDIEPLGNQVTTNKGKQEI